MTPYRLQYTLDAVFNCHNVLYLSRLTSKHLAIFSEGLARRITLMYGHMMCTRLLHPHVTDTCVIIKFVNMCILLRWPSVLEITLLSIRQGFFSSCLVTNMFLFCSYEQNAPGGDWWWVFCLMRLHLNCLHLWYYTLSLLLYYIYPFWQCLTEQSRHHI